MALGYKKQSHQQYVLQHKKVIAKVQQKLKKAGEDQKELPVSAVASETEEVKALPAGYKATLHYKNEGINVTAKIRYETEKVDPLIKTAHMAEGKMVFRRFIGPAKREVWMDDAGKEYDKSKVQTVQILPDGSMKPIVIERTKDVEVEPIEPEVMDEFQPYSFVEVWGEASGDDEGLKKVAWDLIKTGKVGAIREFSHGYGKMYVGFLKPMLSKDGKSFTMEIMLSENRRKRRRWMATDVSAVQKEKAEKPEVPKLF